MNDLRQSLFKSDAEYFLEPLFHELYPAMVSYANTVLHDLSLAEEAAQDTFQIAWIRIDQLTSSPNPQGWLMRTLKNVLRNTQRRRAALRELLVDALEYDEESFLSAANEEIMDLQYGDLINQEDYFLLKLVAIHDYSMLEAAQTVGISVEACKKRIQRARAKLRAALESVEKIK